MDRCGGAAAKLPEGGRKDLAIQALARSQTVSELASQHEVSRKFIYQQTRKARVALDDAFSSATPEDGVLFQFTVTKAWLRQVIVALPLMCHSSYRGVIEFLRLGAHGNGSTIADGSDANRCAGICDLLRCQQAFSALGGERVRSRSLVL